jgi:hypothetical protein
MRNRLANATFLEALAITVVVGAVLLFAAWQLASRPVSPETEELQKDVAFLASQLDILKTRLQSAQAREKVLERETTVLRQANRLLREAESGRQSELNRLQSEIDFYRRLAGTGGSLEGLDIYHLEIIETGSPRVFLYELTLTQNIRRAAIISGRVRVDVEGTLGDRPVSLPWSDISVDDTPEPSFRFKYFQQLEGYLTLPNGFSPTRLLITLESDRQRKPVQRGFSWEEYSRAQAAGDTGQSG